MQSMKLDLRSKWWTLLTLLLGAVFIAWSCYLLIQVGRQQDLVRRNVKIIGKLEKLEDEQEELEAGMFGFSVASVNETRQAISVSSNELQQTEFVRPYVSQVILSVRKMDSLYKIADVSRETDGRISRTYARQVAEESYHAGQATHEAISLVRGMQGQISGDLAGKWTQLNVLVSLACVAVVIIVLLLITTQRNIRKRMELNASLENLVKERTAELERTNRRLLGQIDERIKAEETIRKTELRFEMLINLVSEGVVYSDTEGKMLFVNKMFCELTGYPENELLGKNISMLAEGKLQENKNEMERGIEMKIRQKAGMVLDVLVTGRPLKDDAGNIIGAVSTYLDVTHVRNTEKKLLEKIRDLDMFFYRSSHDLKGPLASMQGLLRLAVNEVQDKTALNYLSMLRQSTDKLHQILLGLIEIVNVTQGKAKPEPVDIGQLAEEIITGLNHLPEREGITIIREIHLREKLLADKAILRSVLQNLLHNAIVYRRKDFNGSFIRFEVSRQGDDVVIVVQDNGVGIPADMKEKVFDVFFRANTDSSGSGLGLYIVKNALEKMKGTIGLQSEEGVGTTFTVRIPAKNLIA